MSNKRALTSKLLLASFLAGAYPSVPSWGNPALTRETPRGLAAHQTGVSPTPSLPDGLDVQATRWLGAYLGIDTTNPPGHELAACRFFESILKQEGIASTIYESGPGRGNLVAVLPGSDPSLGSLILLSHSDVVPADARYWKHPPFSGVEAEGSLWGRGALDMKGLGVAELASFVALKRSGVANKRTIVLMLLADEEMGADYGALWMMKNHPELFEHVEGVINEEGPGVRDGNKVRYWEVRPGQKALLWLKLTARGTPGHGSLPYAQAAPNRLVRALQRLLDYQTPVKLLPETRRFFAQLAERESGERAWGLRHLDEALKRPDFAAWFFANRTYNALVRNTISLTQLEGSNKTNVIPPQASACLDCRLLPGENLDAFEAEVRRVVADTDIEISRLDVCEPVPASSVDTPLFASISRAIHHYHPDALVVTPYSRGANDSRYFQAKGITAYGFYPFALTQAEIDTMHGNDERIPVQEFRTGVHMLYEVVLDMATSEPVCGGSQHGTP